MTSRAVAERVTALSVVTLVVERLELLVTFKFVPKIEAALRVVTLVVERLEIPVTFTFDIKTFVVVSEFDTTKLETEIVEGKSALTNNRNDGAPSPN